MVNAGKRKNRLALISIAALLVIGIIAGTYAYFSQNAQFPNVFKTKPFESTSTETFTPPEDWTPGTTTDKTVTTTNTGETNEIVRVWYEEKWVNANGAEISPVFGDPAESAAIKNLANTTDWVKGADGDKPAGGTETNPFSDYYYYQKVLAPGEATSTFLDSVTFNPNVPTDSTTSKEEIKDAEGNVTGYKSTTTSTGNGYDGATYTLTVHVEVLQADKDAMAGAWKYDTTTTDGGAQSLYEKLPDTSK